MFVQEIEVKMKRKYTTSAHLKTLTSSTDSVQYIRAAHFDDCEDYVEYMLAIYLNRANKVIGHKVISKGGLTGTVCDPRIVIATALKVMACNIILVHNHPSGNLQPSKADEMLTSKVKNGAAFLDMQVVDHLILTPHAIDGYFSFADEGRL